MCPLYYYLMCSHIALYTDFSLANMVTTPLSKEETTHLTTSCTPIYASAYYYVCVRVLLYMCPHTTVYVCACYYVFVRELACMFAHSSEQGGGEALSHKFIHAYICGHILLYMRLWYVDVVCGHTYSRLRTHVQLYADTYYYICVCGM